MLIQNPSEGCSKTVQILAIQTPFEIQRLMWPGVYRAKTREAHASSSLLLSNLYLSDTKAYAPSIRALLGSAAIFCKEVVLKAHALLEHPM